jgi:hypothetical protein
VNFQGGNFSSRKKKEESGIDLWDFKQLSVQLSFGQMRLKKLSSSFTLKFISAFKAQRVSLLFFQSSISLLS